MGFRVLAADLANVLYHFTPSSRLPLGCYETGYKAGNKGARGDYYDPTSLARGPVIGDR